MIKNRLAIKHFGRSGFAFKVTFQEKIDFFCWGKFNVPIFKGSIYYDVNLYQISVLKMTKINLLRPVHTIQFLESIITQIERS